MLIIISKQTMFGLCFEFARKTRGQTFRKRIGMDYKMGKAHQHKNPHVVPMNQKQQLLTSRRGGNWRVLHQLIRDSPRPFGRFQGKKFLFDQSKVPVLDIPDLSDFKLKPYVSFNSPKIDKSIVPPPDMQLKKKPN